MSKIVDRESLKAFRERLDEKYVIEGEYSPQTTVGLADNFTPYSEDSGDNQENPFISNGTGTNNNQKIVTVGDYGLLRSKNGNTVCVNQYVQNGNFASTSGWIQSYCSLSVSNGVGTVTTDTISGGNAILRQNAKTVIGHKYLIEFEYFIPNTNSSLTIISAGLRGQVNNYNVVNNWTKVKAITTSNQSNDIIIFYNTGATTSGDYYQIKNVNVIDLTQWFNGNIPQDILDNPSHFSWYYNGDLSYNTGTLVNANGVKLVSTGRNQWDEEWELGYYNVNTGNKGSATTELRCKNPIKVIPNSTYHFHMPNSMNVLYYDKDMNFISYHGYTSNSTFTTPANCEYITFNLGSAYGTTYNHDITISIYYTPAQGGEGYDKYYPYETPYEVNTGSEVLRSAGSVYDYKTPDGTIHRVVGVVDLGTLNWTRSSSGLFISSQLNIIVTDGNILNNYYILSTAKYTKVKLWAMPSVDQTLKLSAIEENGRLYIQDTDYNDASAFKTAMSGVIMYYALAIPTTEQGTPFAENLQINDYGMLYWDSDIPQGNTIFFPINYKGFLDDMYSRVDGDSSKYVIDTQLQASETQRDTIDTQLQNAIGGTLRQCLCVKKSLDFDNTNVVDLWILAWTINTDQSFNRFQAGLSGIGSTFDNCLSTKYGTPTSSLGSSQENKTIKLGSNNQIYVRDDSINNLDDFKNAMKGVLLAYEKA